MNPSPLVSQTGGVSLETDQQLPLLQGCKISTCGELDTVMRSMAGICSSLIIGELILQ
jgi:hypothetical protein